MPGTARARGRASVGLHVGVGVASFGAEDGEGLVKPKAYVVLRESQAAGPELASSLQGFVKERLAVYKYPRWVEFLPELPKTATGKIQRYKLRQPD